MISEKIISGLAEILKDENDVITDPRTLENYAKPVFIVDALKYECPVFTPSLVVLPKSTEEVSRIVSFAHSIRLSVYVQSGGTDTAGGSAPIDPNGIFLDLRKMNNVLELDAESMFASVQAGIVLKDLDDILIKKKLTHGHRPDSYPVATVGGSISHYGVGQESSGFGLLADNVIGMVVVMPTGDTLRIRSVQKSSMGEKNLLWLFLARQGQHGIITEVTLKLYPYFKENRRTMLLRFPSFESAVEASFLISRQGFRPSMQAVVEMTNGDVRTAPILPSLGNREENKKHFWGVMTLIFDGSRKLLVELEMNEAAKVCEQAGGVVIADSLVKEFEENRDLRRGADTMKNELLELRVLKPTEWFVWTSFMRNRDLLEFLKGAKKVCTNCGVHMSSRSFSAHPMTVMMGLNSQDRTDLQQNNNNDYGDRERLARCRYDMIRMAQSLGGTAASFHSSLLSYKAVAESELGALGFQLLAKIKKTLDPEETFARGQAER